MMDKCWYPMVHKSKAITGMFSHTITVNFPLLPIDQQEKQRLHWIEIERKIEDALKIKDSFEPWNIMPEW